MQLPPFEPTHTIRRPSSQKLNIYYTLTLLWINAKSKTRNENSKQIPLTFFSGPQLSVCKQDPTARRKSKLLKGGISFEETKPPWKNARLLQPQKPCQRDLKKRPLVGNKPKQKRKLYNAEDRQNRKLQEVERIKQIWEQSRETQVASKQATIRNSFSQKKRWEQCGGSFEGLVCEEEESKRTRRARQTWGGRGTRPAGSHNGAGVTGTDEGPGSGAGRAGTPPAWKYPPKDSPDPRIPLAVTDRVNFWVWEISTFFTLGLFSDCITGLGHRSQITEGP
jgi:hypothetical protein